MMFNHPYTFTQHAFPPIIGSLSSPSVEQICQKNNLSFTEMLRPFCTVNVEHHLRDPSGNDHLVKNLYVRIQDVNDVPPQPTLAKKLLNESVRNASCETTKQFVINNTTLDIPTDCKWFHSWCKTLLSVQYPSDHEFTKHLLGCLLVTSTVDPPETLQLLLQTLQQMQAVTPSKLPKWFSPNIFKFYVLVHDVRDGDRDKAIKFFNSLKSAYGSENCFFLEINSQQQPTPSTVIHDYWVQYIYNRNQDLDGSDHGSSPRTPAEMNSLGVMPSNLVNDSDGVTRSEVLPEVAQEAGEVQQPVVVHPLSPDLEVAPSLTPNKNQVQSSDVVRVVNSDVWTGLQSSINQHGNLLTPSDVGNIKNLVKHLVLQVLIPHVEKQIYHLSDSASNKKGVSRSLLSATKRLFSTSKPGSSGSSLNSVVYAFDAPELQLRRLGDLYFMFTNYSMAFQAYHSVKRDFAADQAYLHLAGALEMAALSGFMQGDTGRKALDYMEESILTYLNSCKLPQFATRATLLSTQFLRDRHMYGEAAKQLIRMTSEDSDLRSALLLEQASYCFLHSTRPTMSRKYAFHMVLAGHRFSKAGQRKHALRCYKQAFQIYENKGWNLAEDHIHYTTGRLAGHLKLLKEGSKSLSSLLSSGKKQTPGQQVTYLREYLQMLQISGNEIRPFITYYKFEIGFSCNANSESYKILPDASAQAFLASAAKADILVPMLKGLNKAISHQLRLKNCAAYLELNREEPSTELIVLPLPVVEENSSCVLVSVSPTTNLVKLFESNSQADGFEWAKMEELALTESQGAPMIFRPSLNLFDRNTNNIAHPVVVAKETIYVQISLKNPLQITLPLLRIRLLWNFYKPDGELISNTGENDSYNTLVHTNVLESVNISPHSSQKVILTLQPQCPGQVDILGIHYTLSCPTDKTVQFADIPAVEGKQLFTVRGRKMKPKKEQSDISYETDNRLKIKIIEALPLLEADSDNFKTTLLCGQIEKSVIKLKNSGNAPLKNLYIVTCLSQMFSMSKTSVVTEKIIVGGGSEAGQEYGEGVKPKNYTYKIAKIKLPDDVLDAGEETSFPIWIRAPDQRGVTNIKMLFYYENPLETGAMRYRITRFNRDITVHDSLQLSAIVSRSNLYEDKDTMNIAVTVKNLHDVSDVLGAVKIFLVQIILATTKWELQPKAIYSKDLKLCSQESYSFVVRASRSSSDLKEISDIYLEDGVVEPGSQQPFYDFYKWHVYDEKDASDNLYKMVLCLKWKGDVTRHGEASETVAGLSHVTLTDLAVPSVWPFDSQIPAVSGDQIETLKIFGPNRMRTGRKMTRAVHLENALSYNLLHDHWVEHSFREKRICRVEMRLILRNCIDSPLRVMINTPGAKFIRPTVTRTQLYTPHSSSTFNWSSRSNALVKLMGNERCSVVLAAAFTSPGTYDLGSRLTVAAAMEGDPEFTVQLCTVESSIIISDAESSSAAERTFGN